MKSLKCYCNNVQVQRILREKSTVLALIQIVGFLHNSDYLCPIYWFIFLTLGCIFQCISLSFCFCWHFVIIPYSALRVGPRQQEPGPRPSPWGLLLEFQQDLIKSRTKEIRLYDYVSYCLHLIWMEYVRVATGQQKLDGPWRAQAHTVLYFSSLSWPSSSPFSIPIGRPTTNSLDSVSLRVLQRTKTIWDFFF